MLIAFGAPLIILPTVVTILFRATHQPQPLPEVSTPDYAKEQWDGGSFPESLILPDTLRVDELPLGQRRCTIYWYVSIERHVWIHSDKGDNGLHLSEPPCGDRYATVHRETDGVHISVPSRTKSRPDITDSYYAELKYVRAVDVEIVK